MACLPASGEHFYVGCGIKQERILNFMTAEQLLGWAGSVESAIY